MDLAKCILSDLCIQGIFLQQSLSINSKFPLTIKRSWSWTRKKSTNWQITNFWSKCTNLLKPKTSTSSSWITAQEVNCFIFCEKSNGWLKNKPEFILSKFYSVFNTFTKKESCTVISSHKMSWSTVKVTLKLQILDWPNNVVISLTLSVVVLSTCLQKL